jgi:uncharacterized cupin superfamily protein
MPRIDPLAVPERVGSSYPAPFHEPCAARGRRRLGDVAGLTQFGVNLLTLPPGAWSSQRHWHLREDEFVYVLAGEVVLVEDTGETVLHPGDCAGWKAGVPNGHHLVNRGPAVARVLEVGTRDPNEEAVYADIDMRVGPDGVYTRKDGTPYPKRTA